MQKTTTLKAFASEALSANAFSVGSAGNIKPKVVASSNLGLKLGNAFGVQIRALLPVFNVYC